MLFKWKLSGSCCSFYFVETESIHHMFYEFFHATRISEWLAVCDIEIPELSLNI